jgi:hypothetical protein
MKRRTRIVLGLAAFYTALWLLWFTPVGFPLRIFVVLLHELSHAAAAIGTGGSVERILLNATEGGATYSRGGIPFIILTAGYLGSLLWGLALIEAARLKKNYARWVLGGLGGLIAAVAALYVRNLFGFVFTIVFAVALIVCARKLSRDGVTYVLLALGLTSALYALLDIRSDILARPDAESDAFFLQQMTGIPSIVWGVAWGVIALIACWFALKRMLGRA